MLHFNWTLATVDYFTWTTETDLHNGIDKWMSDIINILF